MPPERTLLEAYWRGCSTIFVVVAATFTSMVVLLWWCGAPIQWHGLGLAALLLLAALGLHGLARLAR